MKLVRKKETDKEIIGWALTSIFGWLSSFAETFGELPIVEMLSKKYPATGCSYCGNEVCTCTLVRKNECRPSQVDDAQLTWGIREFSWHLQAVYGENNQSLSHTESAMRLVEEILEILRTLIVDVHHKELPPPQLDENIASEFADAFAWLLAIANKYEIDLQSVVEKYYNGVHGGCGNRPCTCGELDWVRASTIPHQSSSSTPL